MPGINDAPEQVEEIVDCARRRARCRSAASRCTCAARCAAIFFDWLRAKRPDLVPRYEQMYRRGAYAPREVRERVARLTRTTSDFPRRYLRDRQEMERGRARAERAARAPLQPSLF